MAKGGTLERGDGHDRQRLSARATASPPDAPASLQAGPPSGSPHSSRRGEAITALVYLGPVVAVAVLGAMHAALIGHYPFFATSRFAWSCAYLVMLWVAVYATGLPHDGVRRPIALGTSAAPAAAALAISAFQLALGSALLPRVVVFGTVAVLIPWFGLITVLARRADPAAHDRVRIVAVVDQAEAADLRADLGRSRAHGLALVGVVACDGSSADPEPSLSAAVQRSGASVVVLSRDAQADPDIVAEARHLHARGVRIRDLRQFYEDYLGKIPLTELAQASLLFDVGEVHSLGYYRAKRLIDISVGVAVLPAFLLAIPFVLVLDLLGNRGTLFFRQPRIGKGGIPFTILKFRSMAPGPLTSDWTLADDPRLSMVGRWMRRVHVDELPQILNVLRGNLAVVGPRPEQPRYVEELRRTVPFYDARHLVRPGITGWAQVNYGYGSNELDAMEKLQYDFYYLRKQSVRLDLQVLARTLRSVINANGR